MFLFPLITISLCIQLQLGKFPLDNNFWTANLGRTTIIPPMSKKEEVQSRGPATVQRREHSCCRQQLEELSLLSLVKRRLKRVGLAATDTSGA